MANITCNNCDTEYTIATDIEKVYEWRNNRSSMPHVQDHFPDLDADSRELILSGICGKCFDHMFGGPQ